MDSSSRVAHNSLSTNKPVYLGFPIELDLLVFVEGLCEEPREKPSAMSKDENQQ